MRDPGGWSAVSRSLCHESRIGDGSLVLHEVNQGGEAYLAEADLHTAAIVVGDGDDVVRHSASCCDVGVAEVARAASNASYASSTSCQRRPEWSPSMILREMSSRIDTMDGGVDGREPTFSTARWMQRAIFSASGPGTARVKELTSRSCER